MCTCVVHYIRTPRVLQDLVLLLFLVVVAVFMPQLPTYRTCASVYKRDTASSRKPFDGTTATGDGGSDGAAAPAASAGAAGALVLLVVVWSVTITQRVSSPRRESGGGYMIT